MCGLTGLDETDTFEITWRNLLSAEAGGSSLISSGEAESLDSNHSVDYMYIAELGRGGEGTIYLALAMPFGPKREFRVVKEARLAVGDDPTVASVFFEEATLAKRLHHPCIVETFDVGRKDGAYIIAMEYIEGQPLSRVLRKARNAGTPLSNEIIAHVLLEVLRGLHYAHTLRDDHGEPLCIVHRDVSPGNIVVAYDGRIKVLDFGIAKAASRSVHTKTGYVKGKLRYMAPEQLAAQSVDHRVDIFAAGIVMFECLSRRRMWESMLDVQIATALMNGVYPRSIRDHAPAIPAELDRICARALAFDVSERYASADEMRVDLQAWLGTCADTAYDLSVLMSNVFTKDMHAVRSIVDAQCKRLEEKYARMQPDVQSATDDVQSCAVQAIPRSRAPQACEFVAPEQQPLVASTMASVVPAPAILGCDGGVAMTGKQPRRLGRWIALCLLVGAIMAMAALGARYLL